MVEARPVESRHSGCSVQFTKGALLITSAVPLLLCTGSILQGGTGILLSEQTEQRKLVICNIRPSDLYESLFCS